MKLETAHSAYLEGNSSFLTRPRRLQVSLSAVVLFKLIRSHFKCRYLYPVWQRHQLLYSGSRCNSILTRHDLLGCWPQSRRGPAWYPFSLQFILKSGMGIFQVNYFRLSFQNKADTWHGEQGKWKEKVIVSVFPLLQLSYGVDKLSIKAKCMNTHTFLVQWANKRSQCKQLAQTVVSQCQFQHSFPFSFPPPKWTISLKQWLLIEIMFWKLKNN